MNKKQVKIGLIGIVIFGILGIFGMLLNTTQSNITLSKFTNTISLNNTNAATFWEANTDNPYREKIGSLQDRCNLIILAILKKGEVLDSGNFLTYLSTINTGIKNLSGKSTYAGNIEVQNIIGYIVYEITDIHRVLSINSSGIYTDINHAINTANNEIGSQELKLIVTDSDLITPKESFVQGEKVYGYIRGSNVSEEIGVWACLDVPNENKCLNRATWRQLTKAYNGNPDEWELDAASKQITLKKGLLIGPEYPVGNYIINIAIGQQGAAKSTKITVIHNNSINSTQTTKYGWMPLQAVFGGCSAEPPCNASNVGEVRPPSCGATEPWTCTKIQ